MNQIYTVKETARILGFSTNTVYKYLNEGRLQAARGDMEQGRFRIPHQAIEDFLGTQIPIDILDHLRADEPTEESTPNQINPSLSSIIPSPAPSMPISAARILILVALIAVIIDIIIAPTVSLLSTIIRITILGIFILLSYHHYQVVSEPKLKVHESTDQPTSTLNQQ